MIASELVRKSPKDIRNNNDLMRLYIELYEDAFSVKPNCAGCSFSTDFKKLKSFVESNAYKNNYKPLKIENMNTFKIKNQYKNDILTYKVGKQPFRSYGRALNADFVEAFLSNGSKEEIAKRELMFETLPTTKKTSSEKPKKTKKVKKVKKETAELDVIPEATDLSSLLREELDALAEKLGIEPEKYSNKTLLIEAIKDAQTN